MQDVQKGKSLLLSSSFTHNVPIVWYSGAPGTLRIDPLAIKQ